MSEPNQPYGGYGEPPQLYLYEQYGQSAQPSTPGVTIVTAPPPAPRKSRLGMWIAIGVITALLVGLGGGVALLFSLYSAPAQVARQFCSDLKVQNYSGAYSLLSSNLKSQFTQDQFTQGSRALDMVEGTVTDCGQTKSSNPYSYSLGSNTATVNAVITRATAGALQGAVHLNGSWWSWTIDGLDTSLLGVNMGALATAGALCAALQSQNYITVYGLFGVSLQTVVTQADFVQVAKVQDLIDGNTTACGLVGLGQPNNDTNATLTLTSTRSKLSTRQGTVTLDVESGAWKIASIDPALPGRDVRPYLVGTRFCADLVSGNYADAYALLSARQQSFGTEAQFAAAFTPSPPLKWGGCTADISTYNVSGSPNVSGSTASFNATFAIVNSSTGITTSVNETLSFVLEGSAWKLDNITKA